MIGNISILEQYLRLYQSAISLEDDPKELIGDLLSILRNYSLWEQHLRSLADLHAPLSLILEKCAEIIHNPILIFDLEGNLLGQSNLEKASHFPTFAYVQEQGKMSAKALTVRYVDKNGKPSPDLTDYPQLTHPEDNTETNCLSMYISIDGERVGFCMLVLVDEKELELDEQFISFLKPYFLEAEEFTSVSSPVRSNQTIVADLLSGAGSSQEAIQKFLKNTGLQSPFQLLEIHSNGIVNYTQRSMLVRDLKAMGIPLFVMAYENRVLILTEADRTEMLVKSISGTISTGSSHLAIGISMPFSHLEILPTAHHQAVFAIGEADGKDGIFYCREFAFNYLLRILSGAERTRDLLHPAVDTLSRYDWENGSELLKTLFVYLQQGMNQIHTADALFIHRNTLKYRLARIEELTHIDLDDPEEKLYLSLSLRLAGEK